MHWRVRLSNYRRILSIVLNTQMGRFLLCTPLISQLYIPLGKIETSLHLLRTVSSSTKPVNMTIPPLQLKTGNWSAVAEKDTQYKMALNKISDSLQHNREVYESQSDFLAHSDMRALIYLVHVMDPEYYPSDCNNCFGNLQHYCGYVFVMQVPG